MSRATGGPHTTQPTTSRQLLPPPARFSLDRYRPMNVLKPLCMFQVRPDTQPALIQYRRRSTDVSFFFFVSPATAAYGPYRMQARPRFLMAKLLKKGELKEGTEKEHKFKDRGTKGEIKEDELLEAWQQEWQKVNKYLEYPRWW